MDNQETVDGQEQQEAAPELTVTDLQNLRAIIDAASRRGAFAASEMAAVGAVYNKLDTFLNAVAPGQSADAENAAV